MNITEYIKQYEINLSNQSEDLFENFVSETQLTDEEINESFDSFVNATPEEINEGFFKNLFRKVLGGAKASFDVFKTVPAKAKAGWTKEAEKIKKEQIDKSIDDLVELAHKNGKKVDRDQLLKIIGQANPQDKEQMTKLSQNLGSKDPESIANVVGKLQNAPKKEREAANLKVVAQNTTNKGGDSALTENPKQLSKEDNVPEKTVQNVQNGFKDIEKDIKDLCKSVNVKPEIMAQGLLKIMSGNNELESVKEPAAIYGLICMTLGVMLTKSLANRKTLISQYLQVMGELLEKKKLNKITK